ncbi:MAG: DUF4214 domain-containing protein, partial [Methylococcales bacterium]|nr:DUF4214 domain-containing protein [Methylococcales bacterium]
MAISIPQTDKVIELYSAYFNRAADSTGLTFWKNSFDSYFAAAPAESTADQKEVFALQKIVADMSTSPEYKGFYPSTQSTTEFVNSIYTNLLNRASDSEGLAFWSGHIDKGTMTKEEAILRMIEGAKANTTDEGKADAKLIINKNAVSKYFAEELKSDNLTAAQGAFNGVTSDSATVATAEASLDNLINPGSTTTLTTGIDVLTGTGSSDTFIGTASATNPTVTLGDDLNGAGGTDTLKITTNLASAIPSIVTKSVEEYVITNSGNGGFTVSNLSTGLNKVTFLGGNNNTFALNGLDVANSIALKLEAGQIGLGFKNATGSSDALAISLDNVASTATIITTDIETINLSTTGSKSTLANISGGAGLEKVTVAGDQDLTITAPLVNTITTVDASALTGKLEVSIATGGDVTLTGGAGDDMLTVAGLTDADKIDGGAGNDTLVLGADVVLPIDISGVKNVEALEFTAASSQDLGVLSSTGIKTIKFSDAAGNASYTKNDSSLTHIMSEKTGGDFTATVGTNTSADTLNVELWNADLGTLTATDYETINLKSVVGEGSTSTENVVTTLANSSASTLVITGDTDLIITNALAQGTVDASTFTGKLSIIGSGAADTLKGGTSDDLITGGAGVDTLTGGTGNDKFMTLSSADVDTTNGVITDIITDFASGTNQIGGLAAGSASNYFEDTTPGLNLTSLLALADVKLDGTVKYYAASVGADTYVVADDNGTGYTDVIKLTGASLDNIDSASIIA